MRKIWKGAVVLLITVAMLFSTVAVTADTNEENVVCLTSTPTTSTQPRIENLNRAILWDQYDTDGSNGLSHAPQSAFGYQRALLDDFFIPPDETWELGDFHSLNLWNTMQPGSGTDFHLEFWTDNNMQPGNPIVQASTISYSEAATGRTWFSRPEFEITYEYQTITLTGGPDGTRYWIYGFVIGPENCFWMGRQDVIWGSECWCDYEDYPPMCPGSTIFGDEYDLAFRLTDSAPCEPSVDVEKYVWDAENGKWVDADTKDTALDVAKCDEISYKIVIHNDGTTPLYEIIVRDKMHKSVKFIAGDPDPIEVTEDEDYWYITWYFDGPLMPCDVIEIYITAHVEGPECSYDENYVLVEAYGCGEIVRDDDFAWIHVKGCGIPILRPFLHFLETHPNMFPLLQRMLKKLGVF